MTDASPTITRGEKIVGVFTLAYVLAFTIWFLSIGNYEFIVYIATMAVLGWLVIRNLRKADFPLAILWALSIWGLLHMAGGGVPVGDSVLYSWVIVPLIEVRDTIILKYDQVVHAYGFGVTAWLLWHLMARHFPDLRGTATIYVYPALAAMGLGAANEIIEFSAVLAVPETNVGGYYNTALDLVFNASGAILAMWLVARTEKT
jgi:putative membrane protein